MSDRQKQVDKAVERAFAGKAPSGGKCAARVEGSCFTFHHYAHEVLAYDLKREEVIRQWWEKPTDRRILRAALAALRDRVGRSGRGEQAESEGGDDQFPDNALVERWSGSLRVEGKSQTVNFARGGTVADRGSTFVAVAAFPVRSPAAAHAALAVLRQRPCVSSADAKVSAFLCVGGKDAGKDDGGEAGAFLSLLRADCDPFPLSFLSLSLLSFLDATQQAHLEDSSRPSDAQERRARPLSSRERMPGTLERRASSISQSERYLLSARSALALDKREGWNRGLGYRRERGGGSVVVRVVVRVEVVEVEVETAKIKAIETATAVVVVVVVVVVVASVKKRAVVQEFARKEAVAATTGGTGPDLESGNAN